MIELHRPTGLQVNNVSVTHNGPEGPLCALGTVYFRIETGQSLGLFGPSGTGKTTLLNVIAGLQAPSSGTVIWNQRDIWSMSEDDRAALRACSIGYVRQAFDLLPGFTALQNVSLPLEIVGHSTSDAMARAREILEEIGLAHRLHHKAHQLSQGQAQRVAVARALVHRPALILADEPTASADAEASQTIMDLLLQACTSWGATAIIATHDAAIANALQHVLTIAAGGVHARA